MEVIMKLLPMVLALVSSVAFADGVAGHYVLTGAMEMGSELLLKPDGTFEFAFAYGATDYSASGKWRQLGDSVILDTTPSDAKPFRLTGSSAQNAKGLTVSVKGADGSPVPNLNVAVKTSSGYVAARTDGDGAAAFPQVQSATAAMISVPVYQINAGPFPLNPAHNNFNFEINGEAITTVPFQGEVLRITGRDLELRHWDKDHAMTYQRQ
jgi:hypothetical protein